MSNTIDNGQNVIDSRDIIERIEELESQREDIEAAVEDEEDTTTIDALNEFDESEDGQELKVLQSLSDEASGSGDWAYGATLIRDSYFTEYAEELCKDIGAIPNELPWYIENHIDWAGVAREIQQDYMSVDFDGVEYWVR